MINSRVLGIAFGPCICKQPHVLGCRLKPQQKKGEAHMTIQEVHVQRVNIISTEPFDTVVARIDAPHLV